LKTGSGISRTASITPRQNPVVGQFGCCSGGLWPPVFIFQTIGRAVDDVALAATVPGDGRDSADVSTAARREMLRHGLQSGNTTSEIGVEHALGFFRIGFRVLRGYKVGATAN